MCGIVGFTGNTSAVPVLLDGLEHLEYRGYDSAGVAVVSAGAGLQIQKCKGRLQMLRDRLNALPPLEGTVGIGHTRWATHGEPNDVNSHPHVSQSGRVAIVHNGIIENYAEIKDFLLHRGVRFQSDTDSEVVAQLLDYYFTDHSDPLDAVYAVLDRLEGAYALGILCADRPDMLIAARKDAPLLLGYGDGESFIASDATAIIAHTRDVAYMEDGEVAVLTRAGIQVFDRYRRPVEKEHHFIQWDVSAAEKGGYAHFMFKEIMEQPEALRQTISPRLREGGLCFDELDLPEERLRGFDRVYLVACGSSYHVGMLGKYNLERFLRLPVEVCLASEFRYSSPLVDGRSLVIVISQSGETLDTMAALREAKARGGYILAIVNVVGSSIARESDGVLYTWAGPEIAVATTKAYSTQLVLLTMFGLWMAQKLGRTAPEDCAAVTAELALLPEKLETVLADTDAYQYLASLYFNQDCIFYIGRNLDYALGLEGSLKLKEISYIHSESYAAGELKHGTISLIEPGSLVVALATYGELFDKAVSNIVEVKSRGAAVIGLTTESRAGQMRALATHTLVIPDTHPALQPNLGVVPLQLFAYYIALQRGCDIDKPKNLAKSVTVE